MVTVADLVGHLDARYPEATAQAWDAVGLTVGDPAAEVTTILVAVDIDPVVVAEAIERGAQFLLTHHPLFLSGTTTVAATGPKGRMVHDLISHGIALYTAHTNADIAPGGVNEALADLLGLTGTTPLDPSEHPLAHPGSGLGRVGQLPEPMGLRAFGELVARVLPATEHGVRIHGDPERPIERVAVCGGSGDSYLDAARAAGVDAYLTADLRHHRASEAGAMPGAPALVDVAHFASEWPWVPRVAADLAAAFEVDVHASRLVTDPWTIRLGSTNQGGTR